jgi:hypothetical protein
MARLFALKVLGTIGVPGSLYVLYKNDWDVAMTGVARFGRAGFVVMDIAFDYRRNLYTNVMDPDSDEYSKVRSEVSTSLLYYTVPYGGLTSIVGTQKWGFSSEVQRRPPADIFLNESLPQKPPADTMFMAAMAMVLP